jgi:hypothetical protein
VTQTFVRPSSTFAKNDIVFSNIDVPEKDFGMLSAETRCNRCNLSVSGNQSKNKGSTQGTLLPPALATQPPFRIVRDIAQFI